MKFITAVTTNTACQLPVVILDDVGQWNQEGRGALRRIKQAQVHRGELVPNVSVQVDGNRLKISPQVRKISAAKITKPIGA